MNRLGIPVVVLILAFALMNHFTYWALASSFGFLEYLICIVFLTFEFISKLRQVCSMGNSIVKRTSLKPASTKPQKIQTDMEKSMVKYTVLIVICCCSTVLFSVFLLMAGFFRQGSILQLIGHAIASLFFSCDLFINYLSIILQFAYYKQWYYKIFGRIDTKVAKWLSIQMSVSKTNVQSREISIVE